MADSEQERTEEATQTRREDFRKRGQVAQTRELSTALSLLAVFVGMYLFSRFFVQELFLLFEADLGSMLADSARDGDIIKALTLSATKFLYLLVPAMGVMFLVGAGSTLVQIGFLQVEDAMEPKFERLDPVAGLKKIFSIRNFVEGLKSALKIVLIAFISYLIFRSEIQVIPYLGLQSVGQIANFMGQLTAKLFGFVGLAVLMLALGDYLFQRWDLEKQMMMTKQEVRDESRSREGDPLIRARIRKIQRDVASRRMMQKVPQASVVITNPTHIAVALKYDGTMEAPELLAKGADLVAEKIRSLAIEHEIPIVENKPLARTIFKTMRIGQVIPRELYIAVAEVLSYVFKLKRKMGKR